MPTVCENVTGDRKLLRQTEFLKNRDLVRVKTINNYKTPLGNSTRFKSYVYPPAYRNHAMEIELFNVRRDDIWVTSFAEAGGVWIQELVWLINNNLNYEQAAEVPLNKRYQFFEQCVIAPDDPKVPKINSIDKTRRAESPRYIRSHLPVSLLPAKLWSAQPKLIYVARNPKDVAVAYYHYYKEVLKYKGSLNDFLEIFSKDLVVGAPFHNHVLDYWSIQDEPNILFVTFEELKKDPTTLIAKVAEFLEKPPIVDDDLEKLAQHLSYEAMCDNASVNHNDSYEIVDNLNLNKVIKNRISGNYNDIGIEHEEFLVIKNGTVGLFASEMPEEYVEKLDAWTTKEIGETEFRFDI